MKSVQDLNQLYNDAESSNSELFSEQRSNLLLVAGNHYNRKGSRFWQNLRQTQNISKTEKLRLTKNHIQKITKTYVNNVLTYAPSVMVGPRNESELSDQKAADMHNSVWQDMRSRHKLKGKTRQLVGDFIDIGEGFLKVFFDPGAGQFSGYDAEMDEMGQPVMDETGQPKGQPKFTGDMVHERILGFNLLTDPDAKSFAECRWVIYRKMVAIKDLRKQFQGDDDKLAFISESTKDTYKVFDGSSGSYSTAKGMVMVREYYFRPCADYPNGYYFIATEYGVLHEGELPLGLFPIIYMGFDEITTTARSQSIIKQLRPYQAEVNRTASKISEHQITLGDDKVLLLNGSSISPGGVAHGVKAIKVTGAEPKILQGRAGDQYVGYMNSQISEMYAVANLAEDSEEKMNQMDPYTMLFKSIRDKKKFVLYAEKVQEFLVEWCELSLRYAKAYYSDEMLVPVIGKKEYVNIPEFRNQDDLSYQIKLDPISEDIESKMGKQLSLNHILQYAGTNMDPSDVGKLVRAMPYVNKEEAFSDLTLDYDNARNDILAMDRGQWVPPKKFENHPYVIKKLTSRMKQSDFAYLPPEVQQMYEAKYQQHLQLEEQRQREIQAAKDGFIPTGGYLVSCDFYVPDPVDPSKAPRRARIPYEALAWLLQRLETQGSSQQVLQTMDPQAVADMSTMGLGQAPMQMASQPMSAGGRQLM